MAQNGTMFQKLIQYMQLALTLAAKAAPDMVQGLSNDIMQTMGAGASAAGGMGAASLEQAGQQSGENAIVENARERSNNSAQPDGGAVTGRAKDK